MNKNNYRLIKIEHTEQEDKYIESLSAQVNWIQRQMRYYSFLQRFRVNMNCYKGEIYEFDFGFNINAEFSNRHYGVVLADSLENNPLVIVCPLKTNKNGPNTKSDIDLGIIKDLNTDKSTLAVFNQIRTIDKTRIFHSRIIGLDKNADESELLRIPKLPLIIVDRILDRYWKMLDK